MSQSRSAGSRHDCATRLRRRPPRGVRACHKCNTGPECGPGWTAHCAAGRGIGWWSSPPGTRCSRSTVVCCASRGPSCRSCRSAPPCGRSCVAGLTKRPRPPRMGDTPSARAAASAARWSTPRRPCAVGAAAPCSRLRGRTHPGGPSKCSRGDRSLAGWRAPARLRCAPSPRRSACERELRLARLARSGARPPPRHPLPGFAPMAHDLRHPLLEPAALLLIPRVLDRREIPLHLTSLVAIHLLQLQLVVLPLVDKLPHPVLVGRARNQLGVQGSIDLPLARPDRLPLHFEALLGGLQLGGLVVAQPQSRAHVLVPTLSNLLPQLLSLGGARRRDRRRVFRLLRNERKRRHEHQDPHE